MRRLMHDLSVSEVQAAAMLGNIGWECGGFKALQEVKPRMGGTGGLGWCQWTAARRTSFVNWLKDNGWGSTTATTTPITATCSDELRGPQAPSVLNAVKGTLDGRVRHKEFMDIFERPDAQFAASGQSYRARADCASRIQEGVQCLTNPSTSVVSRYFWTPLWLALGLFAMGPPFFLAVPW